MEVTFWIMGIISELASHFCLSVNFSHKFKSIVLRFQVVLEMHDRNFWQYGLFPSRNSRDVKIFKDRLACELKMNEFVKPDKGYQYHLVSHPPSSDKGFKRIRLLMKMLTDDSSSSTGYQFLQPGTQYA